MTNEEKAYQLYNELSRKWSSLHYGHTINTLVEMAEWKDKQFKEYLEKKINGLTYLTCLTNSMVSIKRYDEMVDVFKQIINELFKEEKK